ncbi:hypothetical protein LX36DRAFT_381606 [Colletotrichum falcatum]|nr:hypothetical protein LX36DRAFT_381606 [Colletotrichum falcatum]
MNACLGISEPVPTARGFILTPAVVHGRDAATRRHRLVDLFRLLRRSFLLFLSSPPLSLTSPQTRPARRPACSPICACRAHRDPRMPCGCPLTPSRDRRPIPLAEPVACPRRCVPWGVFFMLAYWRAGMMAVSLRLIPRTHIRVRHCQVRAPFPSRPLFFVCSKSPDIHILYRQVPRTCMPPYRRGREKVKTIPSMTGNVTRIHASWERQSGPAQFYNND